VISFYLSRDIKKSYAIPRLNARGKSGRRFLLTGIIKDAKRKLSRSRLNRGKFMAVRKNATMEESKTQASAPRGAASAATRQAGAEQMNASPRTAVTRIRIRYNCGFNNNLFIRGKGANLNWEKGQMLKNVKADEWIWETTTPFAELEFKILVNDHHYEQGENHRMRHGDTMDYTPRF
jgi:hypothetical protein